MLMDNPQALYQEISTYIEPAAPVSIVPGLRSAANTDNLVDSDMLARSRRRRRRSGQGGLGSVSAWMAR